MLPFLKKKSDTAAAPAVPAWHPNFRDYEKLPDIKVVRTAFFINFAAISVAVALLTYFGIKEWQLRVLTRQVNDAQRQIDRTKKESEAAIALFKKFQVEEARINEVDAFVKARPSVAALVLHLAQTLPPSIALDSMDLREGGMALRMSIKGTSVAASQSASNYLDQLRADPEMQARFDKFEFTGTPTRNTTTGRVAVEFFFQAKGAKK